MPVVHCIVKAIETLLVSIIDRLRYGTLKHNFNDIFAKIRKKENGELDYCCGLLSNGTRQHEWCDLVLGKLEVELFLVLLPHNVQVDEVLHVVLM